MTKEPDEKPSDSWQSDDSELMAGLVGRLAQSETLPHEHAPATGSLESVGPYRIIEVIGEGGMGVVYRAEQRQPIRRTVALKVIKAGMDSKQVLARFDAEKNALSLMNHPNIARVLDSGQTETGRPFVVMEFVDGTPLTYFCQQERLSLDERLELFRQVCEGVQHAHTKAVVHRDLKPANILVTRVDGDVVPKIIDFGLAKALSVPLTDLTMVTLQRQIVGTPDYMSPEQAGSGGTDVDTRTDVYALGVILYEMLVDRRPLDLLSKGQSEILRVIREDDPPRPSARLSELAAEDRAQLAKARGLETQQFLSRLRGELDWIVLKALDKRREHRYATPLALSDDVERHLVGHQPVVARPPSLVYRLRKSAYRYRVGLAIAALVAIGSATGALMGVNPIIVGSTAAGFVAVAFVVVLSLLQRARAAQAGEARHREVAEDQRRAAEREQALASEEKRQAELARKNADEARSELAERTTDLEAALRVRSTALGSITPSALGRSVVSVQRQQVENSLRAQGASEKELAEALAGLDILAENMNYADFAKAVLKSCVLEPESDAIQKDVSDRAGVEFELRLTIGRTYVSLGDFEAAEVELDRAVVIASELYGAAHLRTAEAKQELATIYSLQGRYDAAEQRILEAHQIHVAALGLDHARTLRSLNLLAGVYIRQGRYDVAERSFGEALDLASPEELLASGSGNLSFVLTLSQLHIQQGHYAEAERWLLATVEALRAQSADFSFDGTAVRMDLAKVQKELGRLDEAARNVEAVLDTLRAEVGEEHPATLSTMHNLAELRTETDQESAEKLYRQVLEIRRRTGGPNAENTLATLNNLAVLYSNQERLGEAEALLEQAYAIGRDRLGGTHPETLRTMHSLAQVYLRQAEYKKGVELAGLAARRLALTLSPKDWRRGLVLKNLGMCQLELGEKEPARDALTEAREILGEAEGSQAEEALAEIDDALARLDG